MARKSAVSEYLAQIGSKGGKASGRARMDKITPENRSAIAKKAAEARWAKPKAAAKSAEIRTAKAAKKPAGKAQKPTAE